MVIPLAIAGAAGRMGRAVSAAIGLDPALTYVGPLEREAGSARERVLDQCRVVIDFTRAGASVELAREAAARGGTSLVIGSTGFDPAQEAAIEAAAARIAVVRSGNFSLGVNLLVGLVAEAAARLAPRDYDIEITEAHHRRKVDAPSGTALMLGRAAAAARGVDLDDVAERVRDGLVGPRAPGAIGFSVVRGGGIVGEHAAIFAAEDEILTLSHSARDRSLFARGALAAAVWLVDRPPGLYDMQDVLGLRRAAPL